MLVALKQEMQSLEASPPEYPVVMEMFGVGPALAPQLMAEIGDVRRFHSPKALVAFVDIDAPSYQSGQMDVRSCSISKRESAALRRTLFLVISVILQRAPMNEPAYQFMNKKRSEGKPYRVYMMAATNKFLRIHYASVKTYLDSLEHDLFSCVIPSGGRVLILGCSAAQISAPFFFASSLEGFT